MGNKRYTKEFKDKILALYDSGNSAREVARRVGKECTSITRILKANGRRIKSGKGTEHSGWKGGRGLKSGYWTVYQPNHPRTLNNGRVWEHILILEKHLGRTITKSEPIHHIDFDRSNNELTNLYVCKNHKEHAHIHASFEATAQELVKRKIIIFKDNKYQMGL